MRRYKTHVSGRSYVSNLLLWQELNLSKDHSLQSVVMCLTNVNASSRLKVILKTIACSCPQGMSIDERQCTVRLQIIKTLLHTCQCTKEERHLPMLSYSQPSRLSMLSLRLHANILTQWTQIITN